MGPPAGTDPQRLARVLGDPDLAWLLDRIAVRLARGTTLDGEAVLSAPTPAQRRAAARLLGRPAGAGASLTVPLPAVAEVLRRAGIAPDLRTAVETLRGPVATTAGLRDREERAKAAALASARGCRHARAGWFQDWLAELAADGTVTKLVRSGRAELLRAAAAVLDRLPADDLPLPVLAQQACGDTKALSGTPLARLVLGALRHWSGAGAPPRQRWAFAGVVLDDLASQVLVLNLPAGGGELGDWLTQAAGSGVPFRVTLHQLALAPLAPRVARLFVCENPAVLRVAAAELGPACAPLVCTEGIPSVACHRLVSAVTAGGATVAWRGDLDWTGLRTTGDALARHQGAVPWRMSVPDYLAGLTETGVPLRGPRAESPWEPELAATMAERGRAVMEEHLLPVLLADLA